MECILRMCLDLIALRLMGTPTATAVTADAASLAIAVTDGRDSGVDMEPVQSSAASVTAQCKEDKEDTRSKSFLPALKAEDFDSLQSHAAELDPMERKDWLRAARFLQRALEVSTATTLITGHHSELCIPTLLEIFMHEIINASQMNSSTEVATHLVHSCLYEMIVPDFSG